MAAAIEESRHTVHTPSCGEGVWVDIARGYAAFSSPLVPSRQDICIYEAAAKRHAASVSSEPFEVMMLGVTPSIATMSWPHRSRILAVDNSPEVIRALWPGDVPGLRQACCASWFDVPARRSSFDMVVGDGSLNACRFPRQFRTVCNAVSALLRSGGVFVVRAYVKPVATEPVKQVFDALMSSASLKVDEFKLRLFMAMQRDSREGVAVSEAAGVLATFGVDERVMRQRFGWVDAAVRPFEKWRASDAVYSFPTLAELQSLLLEHFEDVAATFPAYALGHSCPVLVMRTRRPESESGGE